jgi:hypothetical protein
MPSRETILYCQQLTRHDGTLWYAHFSPHPKVTALYGPHPILKTQVAEIHTETLNSYWGWWNNKEQTFTHVYPTKDLVSMCLPYGAKAHQEIGEGILAPVSIKILE